MRLALSTAIPLPHLADRSSLTRLLTRLVEADARHREMRRLLDLPQHRLADMGLTRPAPLRAPSLPQADWR
jgi:hypothetical protein